MKNMVYVIYYWSFPCGVFSVLFKLSVTYDTRALKSLYKEF